MGDATVGKTSLRKKFMGEGFKQSYGMTIGADFAVFKFDEYTLHLWDLAGQVRFSQILKTYYVGTVGSLLIFDITKPDTFQALPVWIGELVKNNNNQVVPIVLVGNKADLRENVENPVTEEEVMVYVKILQEWSGFDIVYVETSALSGENVEMAFRKLVKLIDSHLANQ